jgi:hypothetical protein
MITALPGLALGLAFSYVSCLRSLSLSRETLESGTVSLDLLPYLTALCRMPCSREHYALETRARWLPVC